MEDRIWDEKQFQSNQHNLVNISGKKDMFVTCFTCEKHFFSFGNHLVMLLCWIEIDFIPYQSSIPQRK